MRAESVVLVGNSRSPDLPNPLVRRTIDWRVVCGRFPLHSSDGGGPRQPILPAFIAASSAGAFGRPLRTKGFLLGGTFEPPGVR